jgi:hypothetical protein
MLNPSLRYPEYVAPSYPRDTLPCREQILGRFGSTIVGSARQLHFVHLVRMTAVLAAKAFMVLYPTLSATAG